MKARYLRLIANETEKLTTKQPYDAAVEQARETQRKVYGPSCAAWIVGAYRKQFKRAGMMKFEVWEKKYKEAHAKRPQFFIGFDYLRGAKNWHGDVVVEGRKLIYRLFWLKHPLGKTMAGVAS